MKATTIHTILLALALPTTAQTIINSIFINGVGSNEWSEDDNWSPADSPGNSASQQFNVTLPENLTNPVILDVSRSINTLNVGAGTILNFDNSRSITLTEDLSTNNGSIVFTGTGATGLVFNHLNDEPITLDGSGTLTLTGGSQRFSGPNNQLLIHGPDHTIQGFSNLGFGVNLGSNDLNFQNQGTITANVANEILEIDPIATFQNTGTVSATNGGILTFLPGIYSGNGVFEVGDNSEFQSSLLNTLFQGITFTANDLDGDPSNNVIRNLFNMDLDDVTFQSGLTITNDGGNQSFDAIGDVTNNALIDFTGNGSFTFNHPSDEPITLDGSGTLTLTGGSQRFTGPNNQLLIHGPDHTIQGFSNLGFGVNLGSNDLNFQNQGTCLLYTSPSPRDQRGSRMPSSA